MQTLDVLLQILIVFPKVESLRSKVYAILLCQGIVLLIFAKYYLIIYQVTSFIHRMVETLGVSVFPYLPKALEQLLAEIEVHYVVLLAL